MLFVNEEYNNYKYLVEAGNNYVILSNSSYANGSWDDPDTIDIIYQYIKPSTTVIETTKTYTSEKYFERVEISNNFWDRGDCPEILTVSILVMWIFIFILNGLTRIAKKGGIFFGQ